MLTAECCVADKIVECNPHKFQASIARPAEMEDRRRRRRTQAVARIHIEGMTCNKCVNFIQSKVIMSGNPSGQSLVTD